MVVEPLGSANTAPAVPAPTAGRPGWTGILPRLFTFAVAAGLVLAYALPGGAYDIVVRQEYGLVIWCLVAIGIGVGLLPRSRPSRLTFLATAGLLAYTAWVGLSLAWTQSAEQTTAELARSLDYLGLFVLAASLVDRRNWRTAAQGLAFGVMVVCVLSVASRLDPRAFPANVVGAVFDTDRLAYPFGYWNAVAAWGAMAMTMGLAWSANDPSRLRRSLALAFVPVASTMTYLSYSRAGVAGAALGLVAVTVLSRHRWTVWLHAAVAAFGTAIVITIIRSHRQIAHATGSRGAAAVLAVLLFACLVCAVAALVTRRIGADDWRAPARAARTALAAGAVALLFVAAIFGPHLVSRGWQEFRNPKITRTANPTERLTSLSGTRYQLWKVALDAFDSRPLTGTGAGTYEFWWNQHQLDPEVVRNAHSIWFESLAELGAPGLLAIAAVMACLLAIGLAVRRMAQRRVSAAAVTALLAAFVVFVLNASVDWMWQSTAVTVLAVSAIAILSGRLSGPRLSLTWPWRAALVAAAVAAAAVQLPGLVSTIDIRRSQAAERRGNGATALAWAGAAVDAEPWAASPYVQRGLVLESAGRLRAAAGDLSTATRNEPTNFAPWVLLARIDTERGRLGRAVQDFGQARKLAPR